MKIFGAIIILCACVFGSYIYEKKQKNRMQYIAEACDFIKHIKSEIEFFCTPYKKIREEYLKNNSSALLFCDDLHEKENFLEKDEKKILQAFFSSIGKGFKDEEISLCEYTYSSLEKKLEKAKEEYPNKIKVFRSMMLFFGVCVIILLI